MKKELKQEHVKVVKGSTKDVDEVARLAVKFFYESDFTATTTLKIRAWRDLLLENILNPNCAALLAIHEEKIIGYALIYRQNDYTEEWIGELFQFYVTPDYRSTGVARALVQAMQNQYDEWDCVRRYAEASAGMSMTGYPKVFENLYAKFGYKPCGIIMKKEVERG